jgi:hypothetical protein
MGFFMAYKFVNFFFFFFKLFRNLSARYVGTTVTGAVGLLNGISRNGAISMGCAALVFQTPRTSMKSHQLRYAFAEFFFGQ